MRHAVGLAAHVYSTPLSEVWEMEVADLLAWGGEAITLIRQTRGG